MLKYFQVLVPFKNLFCWLLLDLSWRRWISKLPWKPISRRNIDRMWLILNHCFPFLDIQFAYKPRWIARSVCWLMLWFKIQTILIKCITPFFKIKNWFLIEIPYIWNFLNQVLPVFLISDHGRVSFQIQALKRLQLWEKCDNIESITNFIFLQIKVLQALDVKKLLATISIWNKIVCQIQAL